MSQTFEWEHDGVVESWDVDRLWKLSKSLPVKKVKVSDLEGVLKIWLMIGALKDKHGIIIRMYYNHFTRTREADLKYPIILSKEGRVMDGMHRLLKAWMAGEKEILAVQFEENPEPDNTMVMTKNVKMFTNLHDAPSKDW